LSIRAGLRVRMEHQRRDVPPAEAPPGADREGHGAAGAAPRGDGRGRAIRVRLFDGEHPPDLRGDCGEHLLRRRRPSDQGRHPAQRGLFLGVAAQLQARLRIGDRGRDQLGEPGQPRLGVGRRRLLVGGRHGHDAQL
jgi:hypothetical protein